MIHDYLRIALINIMHRKLRAWLTVIGIVIGVGAVITLFLVSSGLENAIVEQFNQLGAGRIYVFPKTQIAGSFESALTEQDLDTISSVPGVEWTLGYRITGSGIEFGREKDFTPYLISIQTDNLKEKVEGITYFTPAEGRLFENNERGSAYIGHNIAYEVFEKDIGIGNNLLINNGKFKIIGIAPKIGTPDDNNIFMSDDDFVELFPNFGDEVSFIELKVTDGSDIDEISNRIQNELENARDDENFNIQTPESFLESLQVILTVIQVVLGGIAAISLVVGGIGIANSMFTSVLERTREIGVMKAIGARNSSILLLFLVESAMIGLIGGIIGLLLGIGASLLIERIVINSGFGLLKIIVTPWIIIFGLFFASAVGIISGLIPAYRASKQKPIDALRS